MYDNQTCIAAPAVLLFAFARIPCSSSERRRGSRAEALAKAGLATSQFRFDTPQVLPDGSASRAAWGFIIKYF